MKPYPARESLKVAGVCVRTVMFLRRAERSQAHIGTHTLLVIEHSQRVYLEASSYCPGMVELHCCRTSLAAAVAAVTIYVSRVPT
eukprot:2830523-Pyramimonas_sp.AAC.1